MIWVPILRQLLRQLVLMFRYQNKKNKNKYELFFFFLSISKFQVATIATVDFYGITTLRKKCHLYSTYAKIVGKSIDNFFFLNNWFIIYIYIPLTIKPH